MSEKDLKSLVEKGMSQRQIAEKLGCSQSTVKYWLKKYGMKTKFLQCNKEKDFKCADCGETNTKKLLTLKRKGEGYLHHSLCNSCHNKRTIARQRDYKKKAVEFKGGKCAECGYNKCLGSLHFHHPDPTVKEPNWRNIRNMSFAKMKSAIEKCILVCANCHGEIHWNQTDGR